jgi:hypothetical protein
MKTIPPAQLRPNCWIIDKYIYYLKLDGFNFTISKSCPRLSYAKRRIAAGHVYATIRPRYQHFGKAGLAGGINKMNGVIQLSRPGAMLAAASRTSKRCKPFPALKVLDLVKHLAVAKYLQRLAGEGLVGEVGLEPTKA